MVKDPSTSVGDKKDVGFNTWVQKISTEEGMATHSSILAWRIPWTGKAGGLQSMGSQSAMTELLSMHT